MNLKGCLCKNEECAKKVSVSGTLCKHNADSSLDSTPQLPLPKGCLAFLKELLASL